MHTTVYVARKIITMNPMQPFATHVAVREGRILAVGDLERMRQWGPFELDERFAEKVCMPGFVEGHCHLKEGGMWSMPYLGWFDRRDPTGSIWSGLRTMSAVIDRLQQIDRDMLQQGKFDDVPLIAWGFDPIYFGGERMTIAHLDQASTTRPIVVSHANGHLMNVNSPMLKLAGITRESDVEGVMRFENGEPNGELHEPAAMFPVVRAVGKEGVLMPMDATGMNGFASICRFQGVTTATDLVNQLGETELKTLESACGQDDYSVRILPAFKAFHGSRGAKGGC